MSVRKRDFREPPSEAEPDAEGETSEPSTKRRANVYDAVAGRVTQAGFVDKITDPRTSRQPLRPDEVLFKKANAPIRYEEDDYYFAHTKLPANQPLPSSDLLNAIHGYLSTLFARTERPGVPNAWKCMDETALIAFGILMQETAKELLDETGDLAFTEADYNVEDEELDVDKYKHESEGNDGQFSTSGEEMSSDTSSSSSDWASSDAESHS